MDSDIIDISNLDEEPFFSKGGSNFGGGIELLMNDRGSNSKKKKDNEDNIDIDIDELTHIENELNELSVNTDNNYKSDIFSNERNNVHNVHFENEDNSNLGKATSESNGDTKTWDGFSNFNNVPLNPDKTININMGSTMSKEELLREKFKYLRKLESLEKKGIELTKKYSMDSSLAEMQGEYETIVEERKKTASVKFYGDMMKLCVNGIEMLSGKFNDVIDLDLDGWGMSIDENITDYDEVFGELHEKYKSSGAMLPELKLMFMLGGSATMVHMQNTMFKTKAASTDDVMNQNPDVMRAFQQATLSTMGQPSSQNSGFAGFMNGVMNSEPTIPRGTGPPPPMATQKMQPMQERPGNNYSSKATEINLNMTRPNFSDEGISVRNNFGNAIQQQQPNKSSRRITPLPTPLEQERKPMKGPSDISEILSGLKTKTINIQQPQPIFENQNESSTISISELKELQGDLNIPKRSGGKRKQKSEKNTISLDI
jgi:hypothetical protein